MGAFRLVSLHYYSFAVTPLQIVCPGGLLTHPDALGQREDGYLPGARLRCLCKLPVALLLEEVMYLFFGSKVYIPATPVLREVTSKTYDSFSWNESRSPVLYAEQNADSIKPHTKIIDFLEKSNAAAGLLY